MKKICLIASVLVVATGVAVWAWSNKSSISLTPRAYGEATGVASFLAYERVAASKGDGFRSMVESVWNAVDGIETVEQLVEAADPLGRAFDEVASQECLTDSERAFLLSFKSRVMDKVEEIASKRLGSSEQALAFLQGLRDGIRAAGALSVSKKEDAASK